MATRQVVVESFGLPRAVDVHERVSGSALWALARSARYSGSGLRLCVDVGLGDAYAWTADDAVHGCVPAELGLRADSPAFTIRARPAGLLVAPSRHGADTAALRATRAGAWLFAEGAVEVDEHDPRFLTDAEVAIYRSQGLVDDDGNLDFGP